jgi:hypothetical protein
LRAETPVSPITTALNLAVGHSDDNGHSAPFEHMIYRNAPSATLIDAGCERLNTTNCDQPSSGFPWFPGPINISNFHIVTSNNECFLLTIFNPELLIIQVK